MTAVGSLVGSVRDSIRGSRGHVAEIPAGLGWSPSWAIGAGAGRGYTPALSSSSLRTTPGTTIYVSTTGSNANSGLTPAQAKRDFQPGTGAYSLIGGGSALPTRIVVEAGDYYNDRGWRGLAITTETTYLEIVASGGRVRMLSQEAALTYSSAGSGAYQVALATAPFGVYDELQLDGYGAGTWLTQQASLAAVQSSGGWFHSAGTLYVKTFDARSPDRWVCAAQTGINGFVGNQAALSTYHSGVDWIGFVTGIYAVAANRFIVEDCRAIAGQTSGIQCDACTDAYMLRATAMSSYNGDGLVYSATGNIAEVDCVGVSNGWSASDTSNGSTSHGATVIRCGGRYYNNKGPNVADVRASAAGSLSLNLGVATGASRAVTAIQRVNFCTDANRTVAQTSSMWLVDCLVDNKGTTDLYGITAGSQFFVRNTGYFGLAGSGTVATF